MVSKKFLPMFNLWQQELAHFGYMNFAQVLNSRDFGIPQNRERIFLVSIRDDGEFPTFSFPQPFPLEKKLKDVLEEHVDEKYYLSDKMLEYFQRVNDDDSHGHKFKPTDGGGVCNDSESQPCRQRGRQLRVGRVNSSQDGVVLDPEGISQCHSAGHSNQPKVIE